VAPSVSLRPSTHESPSTAASSSVRASESEAPSARAVATPAPPSPTATPRSDGQTVLLAPDRSFQITTSFGWKLRETEAPTLSATIGGPAGSSGRQFTLDASRGDAQGGVTTCRKPADYWEICRRVVAQTLDALVTAFDTRLVARRRDVELHHEAAVVLEYQAQERPARGIRSLVYILAMHLGRPYAIRLWSSTSLAIGRVDDVVGGFRFLGADPAALSLHFIDDGSAKVQLPGPWSRTSGPGDGVAYFTDGQRHLSIRHGDDDGRVRMCDSAGASDRCAETQVTTLDQLVAAVDGAGLAPTIKENAALDGERAVILLPDPGGSSVASPVALVLAMHEGRPWVIRLWGRPPGIDLIALDDVLRGMSFLGQVATG